MRPIVEERVVILQAGVISVESLKKVFVPFSLFLQICIIIHTAY